MGKKEFDMAIRDYDEAIRLEPNSAIAFYGRGNVWCYKNEYDKAIKDYDEAIRLEPKYAIAFLSRGNVWNDRKEYDKAIKEYDEAIRLDPNLALALRGGEGRGLPSKSTPRQRRITKANGLDPISVVAYILRGKFWLSKGEFDKAIEDYNEALRINPKSAVPLF